MADALILHRGAYAGGQFPRFRYYDSTGDLPEGEGYTIEDDGKVAGVQNWRIRFLKSGTLEMAKDWTVDVFLVGGGGSAGGSSSRGFGGAGGGYTNTVSNKSIAAGAKCSVVIGAGANNTGGQEGLDGSPSTMKIGSTTYTANGGQRGFWENGGKGGCGGGGAGESYDDESRNLTGRPGKGGSNGGNGENGRQAQSTAVYGSGGTGQGSPTSEFKESNATLYGGGGGGGNWTRGDVDADTVNNHNAGGSGGGGNGYAKGHDINDTVAPCEKSGERNGKDYLGGGGGSGGLGVLGGKGGCGIVIIRNHRG